MNEEQKQLLKKKLAEWAGLNPEGMVAQSLIQSLDACFKWLVPKLKQEYSIHLDYNCLLEGDSWRAVLPRLLRDGSWVIETEGAVGEAETPALALCLAIEKLIDEEIKNDDRD